MVLDYVKLIRNTTHQKRACGYPGDESEEVGKILGGMKGALGLASHSNVGEKQHHP